MDTLPATFVSIVLDPTDSAIVLVTFRVGPDRDDLVLRISRSEVGRVMMDAQRAVPIVGVAS